MSAARSPQSSQLSLPRRVKAVGTARHSRRGDTQNVGHGPGLSNPAVREDIAALGTRRHNRPFNRQCAPPQVRRSSAAAGMCRRAKHRRGSVRSRRSAGQARRVLRPIAAASLPARHFPAPPMLPNGRPNRPEVPPGRHVRQRTESSSTSTPLSSGTGRPPLLSTLPVLLRHPGDLSEGAGWTSPARKAAPLCAPADSAPATANRLDHPLVSSADHARDRPVPVGRLRGHRSR